MTTFRLGGVTVETSWRFDVPLPAVDGPADVSFEVTEAPFTPGFSGSGPCDWLVAGRVDGVEVLRFPSVGDAWVSADRIRVALARPDVAYRVERVFFAVLFPWWLFLRGWLCLHGSAVCRDGEAVAFVGPNGAGKTSAALTLADQGWRFLTDDLVVADPDGRVYPTFPQVRLRPDHAVARFGVGHGLEVAHPATDKLRAPAPPSADGPCALSRMFLLAGLPPPAPVAVAGSEAMLHLMFNSVPRVLLDRAPHRVVWLRRLARIVADVPLLRAGRHGQPPLSD